MNLPVSVMIFLAIVSCFVFLRIIGSQSRWPMARTVAHVFSCVTAAALPHLVSNPIEASVLCGTIVVLIFCETRWLGWFPFLNLRGGSLELAVAAFILSLIGYQNPIAFSVAFIILAVADPLAGYMGRRFGKLGSFFTKSMHGFVTHWVVATSVLVGFNLLLQPNMAWQAMAIQALILGFILSVVEGISGGGWDNLTVPLSAYFLVISVAS